MGADLYIERITNAAKLKWEPAFDEAVAERNRLAQLAEMEARHGKKTRAESFREQAEAAQKRVDEAYNKMYPNTGYFRDSYNGTSVLWRLGLSWWKDAPGGDISAAELPKLREFRDRVAKAKLKPLTLAELKENHCKVDDDENSVEVWQKYFRNKKRRLVRWLNRAVEEVERGGKVCFSC